MIVAEDKISSYPFSAHTLNLRNSPLSGRKNLASLLKFCPSPCVVGDEVD